MAKVALISGNAGFIGRNFTQALLDKGWEVSGFDIASGEEFDAVKVLPQIDTKYDLFIHAAANVGGRVAIDGDPLWIMRNVEIDRAAFNFAIKTKTPMVYFSSSAVYPVDLQLRSTTPRTLPESAVSLSTNRFGMPDNTYGWTKLTGERMVEVARQKGAKITVVRPFSGYGSDQSTDYPFGSFLAKAKSDSKTFEIWGDGKQTRDWIHVEDIINACLVLALDHDITLPVNLCTGIPTSFDDLATKFMMVSRNFKQKVYKTDAPTGCDYRVGSPVLLNQFYQPKVSLEEGIIRAFK